MNIKINNEAKRVEVWVDNTEKQSYKNTAEYQNVISAYKREYSICIFVGGLKPLLPTIITLLETQSVQGGIKVG